MKYFLLPILYLLIAVNAYSECSMGSIGFTTQNKIEGRKGIIIMEFYGQCRSIIPKINKPYQLFLIDENNKIPLKIVETFTGQFDIAQIVLQPSEHLSENIIYKFHIEKVEGFLKEPVMFNDSYLMSKEGTTFTVATQSNDKSFFISQPTLLKKTMVAYGCGPAAWLYFRLADQSANSFVRATVKSIESGKSTAYILPVNEGIIKIGHGMCGGAFSFKDGKKYEVVFTSIFDSMNAGKAPTPFYFERPDTYTNEE